MNFNRVAGLGIASIVLFGSVVSVVVSPEVAEARPAHQDTIVANKSKSLIASGNFVKSEKATTGKAKIVNMNGKRYLKFDEAFSTGNGPDVKVILHKSSTVPGNIQEGNYITLAPIQKFKGAQTYEIPENVNLDEFKSVGIWCEEFNATFGYASLQNT
ncbi:DM13 domain-containing protein [Mastigocoleus testarum]|uniref:Electron transfer flavoprotein n=1 Tax=Mastigocoleus testarum BC008 TaxID=371196 RepID=A0A0V7ZU53_9CYAN|nr:DM13 domain-containing protein [Mastigocoleus testarum]KST67906.1 electron transfer flavoprotein [Mastigocoleus testarum BC008]